MVILVTYLGVGVTWVLVRSGAGYQFILYIAYAVIFLLAIIAVAFLRSNYREKHKLRQDLRQFDLDKVSCREEFDRKFIHAAISKWYGTKEAFTEFVRQDLRKDLEPRLAARFPIRYHLLICAAILCASLEFFLALWKAGAPTESILCFAMAIVLGVNGFVVVFISIAANYLSDRFAARRFGCCDHVQTLLILGSPPPWLQRFGVSPSASFTGIEISIGGAPVTRAHLEAGSNMAQPLDITGGVDVLGPWVEQGFVLGLIDWVWMAPSVAVRSHLRRSRRGSQRHEPEEGETNFGQEASSFWCTRGTAESGT
eukprot:s4694_g1.t1